MYEAYSEYASLSSIGIVHSGFTKTLGTFPTKQTYFTLPIAVSQKIQAGQKWDHVWDE